jgi:F-type H+-transporting ATPase subunit gamma
MGQSTIDIKRRIKSVGNTKKITKAMELVSAAKMRKATANVLSSRNYSTLAWNLIRRLAGKTDSKLHPLLKSKKEVKKIGLLLITSNKGLCGGFNSHIINKAVNYVKKNSDQDVAVELIVLGKRGGKFMAKRNYQIAADFEKLDIAPDAIGIRPIAKLLMEGFLSGQYDKVGVAYTDFISTLVQQPRVLEILPLDSEADEELGQVNKGEGENQKSAELDSTEYLFEPSPEEVLRDLLPRLIETQIYQAILESDASEHSARMVAMRNATDAAKEMIDELTLVFNKARQAAITAELADISGGRAAVE